MNEISNVQHPMCPPVYMKMTNNCMSVRQLLLFPLNPLKQFLAKIYYVCSCPSIPVDDHRHANALKLLVTRTLPLLLCIH